MAKRGPKTKASRGERKHIHMNITLPAEIVDKLASIAGAKRLTRSEAIAFLLKKAMQDY